MGIKRKIRKGQRMAEEQQEERQVAVERVNVKVVRPDRAYRVVVDPQDLTLEQFKQQLDLENETLLVNDVYGATPLLSIDSTARLAGALHFAEKFRGGVMTVQVAQEYQNAVEQQRKKFATRKRFFKFFLGCYWWPCTSLASSESPSLSL